MDVLDEKMLSRRENPAPAADLLEPSYRESVRRFNERRRRENRARWFSFYSGMAELHRRLADEHEARAEQLCQDPPAHPHDKDGSGPYCRTESRGRYQRGAQSVAGNYKDSGRRIDKPNVLTQ